MINEGPRPLTKGPGKQNLRGCSGSLQSTRQALPREGSLATRQGPGQTFGVWIPAPLFLAMRTWSWYLILCFIVSPGNNLPVSLGLNEKFAKYLTQVDQVKELFQDCPPVIHLNQTVWGREVAGRQLSFPTQRSFSLRRDITVKHNVRHSSRLCFPCPLALEGFEQEIISRKRANNGPDKLMGCHCH